VRACASANSPGCVLNASEMTSQRRLRRCREHIQSLHRNRERGSYGPMLAAQCRMARVALGLDVRELAAVAGVNPGTVRRLEKGGELQPRTTRAIRLALESAGAVLFPDGAVRLRKGGPTKKSTP
jgi:DNA-binding XRE family transcriptional regulator